MEYPLSAVLRREVVGDLVGDDGQLKAATDVPGMQTIFPLLVAVKELSVHVEVGVGKSGDTVVDTTTDGEGLGVEEVKDMEVEEEEEEVRVEDYAQVVLGRVVVEEERWQLMQMTAMPADLAGQPAVTLEDLPCIRMSVGEEMVDKGESVVVEGSLVTGRSMLRDRHPRLTSTRLRQLCGRIDGYLSETLAGGREGRLQPVENRVRYCLQVCGVKLFEGI